MALRNYISTISQMENLYYNNPQFLSALGDLSTPYLEKADAAYDTNVAGIYNPVYGRMAWTQLNLEANAFGVLPKYPWQTTGWRVHNARAFGNSESDGSESHVGRGFVSEGAALPDTLRESFTEVAAKPKVIATNFDVTEVMQALSANTNDDHIGDMEYLKPLYSARHRENVNRQLLTDVDTLASNGFESIDRVCSSSVEQAAVAFTAADEDIYGLDRSANTVFDANVRQNGGTPRDLTDNLVRGLIADIGNNGGETNVILTGWDTDAAVKGIYDTQVRYNPLDHTQVKLGVNGVESPRGIGVGIGVNALYGIPMIVSKDVVKDTISRMYFLDTSDPEGYGIPRLGFRVLKPTQYFEAGIDSAVPETVFGINKLATEGMYRTMGELICRRFNTQGKIRDLK